MQHLVIKNFGPLKHIDINLKRFNVFIGPQSSGKSTIAKIISFCRWLEKDCIAKQSVSHVDEKFVEGKLVEYHNFEDYIYPDSYFKYESDIIDIEYSKNKLTVTKSEGFKKAFLSKNAYIPAERNIVAIPGIMSVKMPYNYIRDFIYDWQYIRDKYKGDDKIKVLNLGGRYHYDVNNNSDMLLLDNGRDIHLSQASSGLQSVTPICVYIDFITEWIYNHEESKSPESIKILKETIEKAVDERIKDKIPLESLRELIMELSKRIYRPYYSNLVIEEPEQNLFPATQLKLLYFLLSKLKHDRDTLVVTTHSPYILYALNNCMLAYLCAEYEDVKDLIEIPENAFLNPKEVSVWETADGEIRNNSSIQDENGLIRGNYFDKIMHNIMADFNNLLSLRQ